MNQTARPPCGAKSAPPARGSAALAVTMLLLMLSSIGVLYVNRGALFEQRTAANQMLSTTAQEVAEAGLEWATGMLNTPYDLDAACQLQATAVEGFRKRYVLTRWNAATSPSTDVAPATGVFPGCKVNGSTLSCSCPAVPASGGAVASLGSDNLPSFTVAFEAVSGDAESVKVTVYACLAQAAACTGSNYLQADGNARLTALMKLRPTLRAMPSSALTCGSTCTVGGSYNIFNTDVSTNGILINAGSSITPGEGTLFKTLPGQPAENALVGGDQSLADLSSNDSTCSNSAMFNAYFGTTMQQYRDLPTTKRLSCGSAADCNTKLDAAYAAGWRAFYMDTDLHLSGSTTYGSATDPITLVTPMAIDINGTNTFYGLIFSNDATMTDLGTGNSKVFGAQVSCAAYRNNGNGTLSYDRGVLNNARRLTGLFARVPGSWRDFRIASDALP